MTDYKQLCAELVDDLELCDCPLKLKEIIRADIDRARAALAEPEPQRRCIYNPVQIAECGGPCEQGPEHCDCGELWVTEPEPKEPTSRQLMMLADDMEMASVSDAVEYARAVLARWGNHPGSPGSSTPQPVPVSERLPGDELCWWYEPDEDDGYGGMWTLLRIRGNTTRYSHWLPANALTQPS